VHPTISEDLLAQPDVKLTEDGYPSVPSPLGLSLGGEALSASEKFDILSRSNEYLQLQNALGDRTLTKPNVKRCRVSLPKRVFDGKMDTYLEECDLKPEAMLWLQRLHAHWVNDVSSSQALLRLSSSPTLAQSCSPTGLDEVTPPLLPQAMLSTPVPPLQAPPHPLDAKLLPSQGLPPQLTPPPLPEPLTPPPVPLASPTVSTLLQFLSSVTAPSNLQSFDACLVRLYKTRQDFLRAHTIQKVLLCVRVCYMCVVCVVCVVCCVLCGVCVCCVCMCVLFTVLHVYVYAGVLCV
jgi:hypothetical protein